VTDFGIKPNTWYAVDGQGQLVEVVP